MKSHHHHHHHQHRSSPSNYYYSFFSSSSTSISRTISRLIILIILFIGITHHISHVDGYGFSGGFGGGLGGAGGGGGGRFSSGGFGRSSIGSSFGGRFSGAGARFGAGGGGGTFFTRPRWWILGAGTFGSHHSRALHSNHSGGGGGSEDFSIDGKHTPATVDQLAGVVGIFYVVSWTIYFGYKLTFSVGQYGQSDYALIHCLSFVSYTIFSLVAFYIPLELHQKKARLALEEEELLSEDAWDQWFDSNSTLFIQIGDSPLNYFDLAFCSIGMLLTTIIILKDCAFTNGLLTINMITKVTTFIFLVVMSTALYIGYTSSWKIPLVIYSVTSLVLALVRYAGLALVHEHTGCMSISSAEKGSFVPTARQKCFWLNRLELLSGLLSIAFHILMVYNYEDSTIAFINSIPIGIAILGIAFSLLYMVCLAVTKPRYDRYTVPPTCCGETFDDGTDTCKEMFKMH